MKYVEMIKEALESMRLRPEIDSDGEILVVSQSYKYRIQVQEDVKGAFVNVVLCPFLPLVEQEEKMVSIYVCNKANLELRLVKVCVTPDMDAIFASAEFYFYNKQMLRYSLKKSLNMLGVVGPWCRHELEIYAQNMKDDKRE